MMSRSWKGLAVLAVLLSLTTQVQAQAICDFFPGLPFCPPPAPELEERVEALEAALADVEDQLTQIGVVNLAQADQINTLMMQVGMLVTDVAANTTAIAALEACCEDLQTRVEALEALANCQDTICNIGGTNFCIDTDTDDDNCGDCGVACLPVEVCETGTCVPKVCPPPSSDCKTVTLMMDGSCVESNLSNTTECDDGLGCTVSDICQSGVCVGFGTPCDTGTCSEDGMGGFTCDDPGPAPAPTTTTSVKRISRR
jgi:hypothetical protein